MTTQNGKQKTLTFRVPGQGRLSGIVKNPEAELGKVASGVAEKLGIAGAFECLDKSSQVISPETRLADLPDEDITLASNLTPAVEPTA